MPQNHLPKVKSQYEAMPYPPCNPQDDKTRLVMTWLEDLPMINHYCFAGKQSFSNGFRALVAGGGTGDATIFLAEQLRGTDAEIVHLDMSHASIVLAQERAKIRGLTNITWVHYSLLSLPALGLGKFDYINCSGVLHHLADPDLGLRVLLSALKPGGAIGLMVYGTTGRTGVYQMQALMRMVNRDGTGQEADDPHKIANTRDLLGSLPASNWFKASESLFNDHKAGDAGIYDLLLHSQDRAYSVGELFDWLEGQHGKHLNFSDVQRGRSPYLPHMVLGSKPPAMAAELRRLPRRQQYEMAELMIGNLITHSLYLTPDAACTAPYGDAAYIPFFYHEPLTGDIAAQVFGSNKGQPFRLTHQHSGVSVTVNPGKYGANILRLIDGEKSFGEIFDQFRAGWQGQAAAPDNAALFADFAESYDTLNALERLLLRHPDATASV
ncbi:MULTISPECIES: class I SAM-dependent methyltransferase [unclassified Polaromonas]|uniref:class I SAM-dependent methyltransferase n=1 Tax=unclassified Polaromonas TaxID=2638319 RepID=UPI0018CAAFEE|nr:MULTISPECIES: class I SAM-dependent methyltransferase [unclassified Polaromonas]MBG6072196.1 SAM-dependent methyltransferase [Polaromonas sp. CG_9.7]MBG6114373.1 SAM-dependent methyltransferase [Polaromonas sp. CG_9.2]MDH6182668.1 SAM-dependent methyltransferase [Polaromonas sp. CG_23.6]